MLAAPRYKDIKGQDHIKNTLSYNRNTGNNDSWRNFYPRMPYYYEAMCRTRRRATVCHIRNSNADLILLQHFWNTLQYNPFIFVGDFTKPQITELDVDKSADVLYIHITVEEQRSRIEYATDTRGSCGATEAQRGAAGRRHRKGGLRRRLNRVSVPRLYNTTYLYSS